MICKHAKWISADVGLLRCGERYRVAECTKRNLTCCPLAPKRRAKRIEVIGVAACVACDKYEEIG